MVFGKQGYHITFRLEEESFQPAIAPADDTEPMDHDDFGADNGNAEDTAKGSAAKKMRSDNSQADTSAPQVENVGSGPTPMQHQIAVTPLGKNRPCPPMKPLVMMDGNETLPLIAVTKPKSGFRPGPGSTFSKFHPLFSSPSRSEILRTLSPVSLFVVGLKSHVGIVFHLA